MGHNCQGSTSPSGRIQSPLSLQSKCILPRRYSGVGQSSALFTCHRPATTGTTSLNQASKQSKFLRGRMASLPPQQSSRNISPSNQRQSHSETPSQHESTAPSMISEDSQTVLLDNPASSTREEKPSGTTQPRPPAPSRSSTLGIKKCWICICDSTEDDPTKPARWRSPCTCNLTAHEACLLDWVADLENTRNRRTSKKIQCPQCKTEIKIARPKSLVLSGVKAWERLTGTLALPGMAGVLGGTIWAGCFCHGLHAVRVVFGEREALAIYRRAHRHWGFLTAYALIPISLIAARTNYADFVLPGSTVFLFATQLTERFAIDWTIWPPRPSTVFGCLPLLRNCYNYLYEKAFGSLNLKWLLEIQPRHGEDGGGGGGGGGWDEADQDARVDEVIAHGDVVLELNLEIGMGNDDDEGGGGEVEQPQHQQARDEREPQPNQAAPAQPDINAPPAPPAAAPNNNPPPAPAPALLNRRPNERISDTSSLLHTTLGALLFPSISACMGHLLLHSLPTTLTTASTPLTLFRNKGREGLLRTRWGRSVVGGCLFVVLKDVLMLYVRWSMARGHRGRRVMDWERGGGGGGEGAYVLRD